MREDDSDHRNDTTRPGFIGRLTAAITLLLLMSAYTYGVLSGQVFPPNRIDGAHLETIVLTLVACALLLLPQMTQRIRGFELYGLKLELNEVRRLQQEQQVELSDVRLLIGLLIPGPERRHLERLARGETTLVGDGKLHSELRKLTSLGLLKRIHGRKRDIGDLKTDVKEDVADVVFVTPLGHAVVKRLTELDAAQGTTTQS
jgi:hypothetical protein